ncbi:MAG: class I SAM-dependent methyltransferase [Bacteroidota bacterium]
MQQDPTKRFSDRVANYILYRPDYPSSIVPFLESAIGLSETSVIADVGSGTGKSSAVFLEYGCPVYAVEPNGPMRLAAEEIFNAYKNFHSINATAELTTLGDSSVDVIISGQAFHWFDPEKSRAEFRRILSDTGWVVLIWNTRNPENAPFMDAYNLFVSEYSDEYGKIYKRRTDTENFDCFFGPNAYQYHILPNSQEFSFEGLKGRYLSSSYAFNESHPQHRVAIDRLKSIFEMYQKDGKVVMPYKTELFFGQL